MTHGIKCKAVAPGTRLVVRRGSIAYSLRFEKVLTDAREVLTDAREVLTDARQAFLASPESLPGRRSTVL
jgi:hypothetical protein